MRFGIFVLIPKCLTTTSLTTSFRGIELQLVIFLIAAINNVIHRDLIDFFCEIEEA